MKWYSNIKTKERWDGKRVFNTTHYPEIPESDTDIYIVTKDTDSLGSLAFLYYKDPTLWRIIALANNLANGRMSLEGGLQLRIPTDIQKFLSDFDRANN